MTVFGGSAIRHERIASSLDTPERPYCCPAPLDLLNWDQARDQADWRKLLTKGVQKKYTGFAKVRYYLFMW